METENVKNEIEIDLKELMHAILDKLAVMILVGVLTAGMAFAYSQFFMDPMYRATTQVYILTKTSTSSDNLTTSDLTFATYLAKDYEVLLTCDPVLQEVVDELGLDSGISSLKRMISVSLIEDTRVMEITVTSGDPELAKQIADKVRDVANDKIKDVMEGVEAVNAVDEAKLPTSPSSPNVQKNTLLGFMLGFGLSLVVVIILFILDDTIKTQEDIEKYLDISVLASIPLKTENEPPKKTKKKKNDYVSEKRRGEE